MANGYFNKMMLLMWKHLQLRKRRYIATSLEIFLPIIIVFLICKGSAPFVDSKSEHKNASIPSAFNLPGLPHDYNLAVSPSTDFAKQIISNLHTILNIQNVTYLSDETQLELFLSAQNKSFFADWFGVVLVSNSTADEKFTYKIRNVDVWFTDSQFYKQETPGATSDDPYLNKGFANLQFALDATYIQTVKPEFSTKTYMKYAKFQPFPYPEYDIENPFRQFIPSAVYAIIILTSIIMASPLVVSIIEEKDGGLKELMKLVGLNECSIWLSWFLNAVVINVFVYTIVTIILYHKFGDATMAPLNETSITVFWSLLMLFCAANITFCFTFCAIFHSTALASTLIVFSYFILGYLSQLVSSKQSLFLSQITCLTPVGALFQGFNRITYAENHGISLGWLSLNAVEGNADVSLEFVMLMLSFDICLYLALTYYITMINPGKFGSPRSPFFIFEQLTSRLRNRNPAHELVNLDDSVESNYFERATSNLVVSLQIKDLHKNFGSVYAVRNVNLNIYKGEITALLGHNGAGKTTTMGILTGTIKPTAGTILYDKGVDVLRQMDQFRQDLGVCTQEDRLFSYLTAIEHLLFFAMLKGYTKNEARNEGMNYLRLMEMEGKADTLPKDLSGGMKRKLCLAMALMGNAKTLILDEPTSGMDVESRRKIWDLLLELRGTRTILLSTHFMEEADALGDRIAIMNHGTIVCHGTSIFLKKAYGTGYELTITRMDDGNTSTLDSVIRGALPDAEKVNEKDGVIVYKLPLTQTASFPQLFKNLEARARELGIANMGVSCTTMEQVFLKVGGASVYDLGATETEPGQGTTVDGNIVSDELEYKQVGGRLVVQQLAALFKKRYLYTVRDWNNLFFKVVLLTLLTIVFFRGLASVERITEPPLDVDLSVYPDAKAMLASASSSDVCAKLKESFGKHGIDVINREQPDMISALLQYGRNDLRSFRKELMFAAECDNEKRTVLYNRLGLHTLPVMINSWSNAILRQLGSNQQIEAINYPISISRKTQTCETVPEAALYSIYLVTFAFISVELLNYFSTYLCVEREDGFKHIQFMSNLSPFVYWLGTWTFDVVFFMVVFTLRVLILKAFDYHNFLAVDEHLAVFMLLTLLFALSGTMFLYVINYMASNKSRASLLMTILNIVGLLAALGYFAIMIAIATTRTTFDSVFDSIYLHIYKYVVLLTPIFNYSVIVLKFVAVWWNNTRCSECTTDDLRAMCKKAFPKRGYFDPVTEGNPYGMLEETIFLAVDVVLYGALLAFIQTGYMDRLWNFVYTSAMEGVWNTHKDGNLVDDEDDDVKNERNNVPSNAILLVNGLKKIYTVWFRPVTAVADVTFAVKPGQCFGLLGVNGAGKSTTFKMLTSYTIPTAGDASIMGATLSQNKTAYLRKVGYCAQTNCFIEELTGREMLTLTASLRGVRANRVNTLVNKWISIVGLGGYQNRRCGSYSGGNKRKLCAAMSLIGDPHVVFLDEPTTGVDPVSRRKLYDVMEQSKRSGQAVVLSSHSMEECEKLCDRLTIMSKGRMKCIGTVQHLKQRYAQGFSILIKTKDTPNRYSLIDDVKGEMTRTFKPQFCVLKDEHKGLLYYQIKDTSLLWSQLFEIMERISSEHEVIEDYTISDTSLEEVFISFAKQASKK